MQTATAQSRRRLLRPSLRTAGAPEHATVYQPRLVPVEDILPLIVGEEDMFWDDHPSRETESLPFVVRIARDRASLLNAVAARHATSTTVPAGLDHHLIEPEPEDLLPDCTVWIAETKLDGRALGTMRVQTNRLRPLSLEKLIALPHWLRGKTLSDVRRMAVVRGPNRMQVVLALLKANLLHLQAQHVAWSVIAARPPMSEVYRQTMLYEAAEAATPAAGSIDGNVPCEVLAFEVATAQARFAAARHPAARFLFDIDHPDICID